MREHTPTDTSGDRAFLELRSRSVAGTERHIVAFLRFDLAGVTKPINAATLRLWIASTGVDSDAFAIDVFGIVDGAPGELNWIASSLSYESAPGLAAADSPTWSRP